jgi:hypothetical protein
VTVIGVDKGREFAGYSIRNHTTGVDYTCPAGRMAKVANGFLWWPFIIGVLVGFGTPVAGVIAFILSSPSFFFWLKFRKHAVAFKQANVMLSTLPTPALASSN